MMVSNRRGQGLPGLSRLLGFILGFIGYVSFGIPIELSSYAARAVLLLSRYESNIARASKTPHPPSTPVSRHALACDSPSSHYIPYP